MEAATVIDTCLLALVLRNFLHLYPEYGSHEWWEFESVLYSMGITNDILADEDLEAAHMWVVLDLWREEFESELKA
jgi:hypothetical protein